MSDKYFLDVACGFVPGRKIVSLFGFVRSAQTHEPPFTIWEPRTLYEFPENVESWEVVSDSPADTFGGPGAQFALIDALGADFGIIDTVFVPLNGTTPVPLPGGAVYYRVNNFMSLAPAPSTTHVNVGTIRLQVAGGGALRHIILPGQGQGTGFFYTVPARHDLWFSHYVILTAKPGGGVATWTDERRFTLADFSQLVLSSATFVSGGLSATIPSGFHVVEKTSFEVRAIDISANGLDIVVQANMILTDLDAPAVTQRLPTAFTGY